MDYEYAHQQMLNSEKNVLLRVVFVGVVSNLIFLMAILPAGFRFIARFYLVECLFTAFYISFFYLRYYKLQKNQYTMWEGRIVDKVGQRGRLEFIKSFAIVDCGHTTFRVNLDIIQSVHMHVGQTVYVAELETSIPLNNAKYTICED